MKTLYCLPEKISDMLNLLDAHLVSYCLEARIIPLTISNQILSVVVSGALSSQQEAAIRFMSHCQVHSEQWPESLFHKALDQVRSYFPQQSAIEGEYHDGQASAHQTLYIMNDSDDEPVIHYINQVISQALTKRASDIHFEPQPTGYRIRQRIDGVLYEIGVSAAVSPARLTARLKVMAQLDIAEKRLPQDGQLTIRVADKDYAIRISTLPTTTGEKVVLRVIEAAKQLLTIEQLGMSSLQQQCYVSALAAPQGVILVTGPTGSGKTVTLYSGLQHLNTTSRNLCTIEDPVEMIQPGINQTQINYKTGLTFSQTLRALLRQDPDVIMVGEIRDRETADIAMEAGQTGHLVMSTLHTTSTVDTIIRLTQMGVPRYLLASGLDLIIAQRLIRCLCQHCKQPQRLPATRQSSEITSDCVLPLDTDWLATGCDYCSGGYHGRTAVYEMLPMTTTIRQALLDNVASSQLKQLAFQQGMVSLFQAARQKVAQGITSLAELHRVLGERQE